MSDAPSSYNIMEEIEKLAPYLVYDVPFLEPSLTDTEVVILSTSLVDKILRVALLSVFREEAASRRTVDSIFEGDGPLATFSAKISLGVMLGLARDDTRHDLTILRKIRNEFAHSPGPLYLRDFSACLSLRMTSSKNIDDPCPARKKFKQASSGVIANLCTTSLLQIAGHRLLRRSGDAWADEYHKMLKEAGIDEALPE